MKEFKIWFLTKKKLGKRLEVDYYWEYNFIQFLDFLKQAKKAGAIIKSEFETTGRPTMASNRQTINYITNNNKMRAKTPKIDKNIIEFYNFI